MGGPKKKKNLSGHNRDAQRVGARAMRSGRRTRLRPSLLSGWLLWICLPPGARGRLWPGGPAGWGKGAEAAGEAHVR